MKIGHKGRRVFIGTWVATAVSAAMLWASGAAAQNRSFSFAYDQPPTTAYGIAGNIFDAKLKELSGGKMSINQFPGAQLGQEPQMLQKMRAGDIDFVITSTANASTLAPLEQTTKLGSNTTNVKATTSNKSQAMFPKQKSLDEEEFVW